MHNYEHVETYEDLLKEKDVTIRLLRLKNQCIAKELQRSRTALSEAIKEKEEAEAKLTAIARVVERYRNNGLYTG